MGCAGSGVFYNYIGSVSPEGAKRKEDTVSEANSLNNESTGDIKSQSTSSLIWVSLYFGHQERFASFPGFG